MSNPIPKYPELDNVAIKLSHIVGQQINLVAPFVESAMPYKCQYVLEKLIEELKKRV